MSILPRLLALCLALVLALAPARMGVAGAAPATLIADSIAVGASGRLTATGNVEVFYKSQVLRADRIVFDPRSDTLDITGDLQLTDGPDMVLLADQGQLSDDFRDGVLTSARLVLGQQLQLAAQQVQRIDGNVTRMTRTVASACKICADRPVPLWQIRAAEIVHDEAAQSLFFTDATVLLGNVPIFYLPRMRLPDPTVRRMTGFLTPKLRSTDTLGTGVKIPYFFTLGQSADITLTPYATTNGARAIEGRLRKAWSFGEVEITGAVANDKKTVDTRGFAQAVGRIALPFDTVLSFDLEDVTDDGFYRDYGYDEKDRIDSEVILDRTGRDRHDRVELAYHTSFRPGDVNDELPRTIAHAGATRRFTPGTIGGQAELTFAAMSYVRPSGADILGRDTSRASVDLAWRGTSVVGAGMVATAMAELAFDSYAFDQDSTIPGTVTRVVPTAAVELRWPFERQGPGYRQVLEPVIQIAWSEGDPQTVPNEDSILNELDEASLFDINRFSGRDRFEGGGRMNLGLTWRQDSDLGWSQGFTIGRVLRDRGDNDFTGASGLAGYTSDWMGVVHFAHADGFDLRARALFEDNLTLTKHEIRAAWTGNVLDLSGTYTWLLADAAEDRLVDTNEFAVAADYRFDPEWSASISWRYDLTADNSRTAGLGLRYQTDCLTLDMTVDHSFTGNAGLTPTTDFGLTVSFDGFGAGTASKVRTCSG